MQGIILSTIKKIQYNVVVFALVSVSLIGAALAQGAESAGAEKPLIITTIKPLAIIAKSAVGENARVEFLQSAVQSAHEVTLPVSALVKIDKAELVIWIGRGFEARIGKSMALLPEAKKITVMDLEMIAADPNTNPDHHDHHHQQLQFDPHIWLNPANGNILASNIQKRLGLPQSAIINSRLVERLNAELEPVKDRNYLTHHDAFAHFVAAFNISSGLSIRDASGASQGARSQYMLRQKALALNASCIFVEPQYADKDARIIARELNLPLTVIDPQGFDQPLTADAYSKFMLGLVSQFKACFE
jgi:zinc transport system substrate-binding protein